MATTTAAQIPKLRFYNPVRNLPQHPAGRSREGVLSYRFAQALIAAAADDFFRTRKTALAYAREIPANGYGIADFVVVSWNPRHLPRRCSKITAEAFMSGINPKVLAFEVKLSNWRKALMQAHRYRFF